MRLKPTAAAYKRVILLGFLAGSGIWYWVLIGAKVVAATFKGAL